MYKFAIYIFILISLFNKGLDSCKSNSYASELRNIHVVYNAPAVNWDGSITDMVDSHDVIYYNDFVMYRLSYRFDSLFNGKQILQEQRSRFFVFHKDSLYGYIYYLNSPHELPIGRLRVDSTLKSNIQTSMYDSLLNVKPDSSYFDAEGNLLKVYNRLASKEDPENFSLYLYYSKKYLGVKEAFSKMDNVKNMKLFRLRLLAYGGYYTKYNMKFPRREMLLEMEDVPLKDKEVVIDYFHKYQNESINKQKPLQSL
jgi:hypothetical protein